MKPAAIGLMLGLVAACRSEPEVAEDPLRAGAAAYERGDFALAVEHYERALAERPEDPQILDLEGEALMELGRLEEALAALDRSIEIDPGNPYAHAHRGQVLVAMGRSAHAIPSFEVAVALAPDVEHFRVYLERARSR